MIQRKQHKSSNIELWVDFWKRHYKLKLFLSIAMAINLICFLTFYSVKIHNLLWSCWVWHLFHWFNSWCPIFFRFLYKHTFIINMRNREINCQRFLCFLLSLLIWEKKFYISFNIIRFILFLWFNWCHCAFFSWFKLRHIIIIEIS